MGSVGDRYHVRIGYDSVCTIRVGDGAPALEIFLLQPCLAEYTIADRNLFQVPSQEFRVAFSRTHQIPIASRPRGDHEAVAARPHTWRFEDALFATNAIDGAQTAVDGTEVIRAVRENQVLNVRTTYKDSSRDLTVTLEYPIRAINVQRAKGQFQVDTGPLVLPDLETWDGSGVSRVFLAHAAFSGWERTEFILRREVEPLATESWWWEVHGRDRRKLRDPSNAPSLPPLPRRNPTVYNETLTMAVVNEILIAPADYSAKPLNSTVASA